MLDRKYICPVCSLILREPVQLTECSDRLCQTCLNAEQEQMNIDLPRTTTAGACIPATAQFEEVHEMLNIFAGGIEALVNNEQRLSNESFQMQITLTILKEESSKLK
ncbi:unnamed protein product [Rotaria sordida]|uniref:Uncharacterized protein n=1 Tax=Rotaria sordida TaxID=392033 RepID=A0A815JFJ1_9BILA|nr:unnamed protein product [Rotaria sordida]